MKNKFIYIFGAVVVIIDQLLNYTLFFKLVNQFY